MVSILNFHRGVLPTSHGFQSHKPVPLMKYPQQTDVFFGSATESRSSLEALWANVLKGVPNEGEGINWFSNQLSAIGNCYRGDVVGKSTITDEQLIFLVQLLRSTNNSIRNSANYALGNMFTLFLRRLEKDRNYRLPQAFDDPSNLNDLLTKGKERVRTAALRVLAEHLKYHPEEPTPRELFDNLDTLLTTGNDHTKTATLHVLEQHLKIHPEDHLPPKLQSEAFWETFLSTPDPYLLQTILIILNLSFKAGFSLPDAFTDKLPELMNNTDPHVVRALNDLLRAIEQRAAPAVIVQSPPPGALVEKDTSVADPPPTPAKKNPNEGPIDLQPVGHEGWTELKNKIPLVHSKQIADRKQIRNSVQSILKNPDKFDINGPALHATLRQENVIKSGKLPEGVDEVTAEHIQDTLMRIGAYVHYHREQYAVFWNKLTEDLNTWVPYLSESNPNVEELTPEDVKKYYPTLSFDETETVVLDRPGQWKELLDAYYGFYNGVALSGQELSQPEFEHIGFTEDHLHVARYPVAHALTQRVLEA